MRIGFDARLMGALGIGRYIGGLLPALAELLGDDLVVIARRRDVAMVRALTTGRGGLITSNAHPYRLSEQSLLIPRLMRARLRLVHFPHYNLPIAFPGRFVATIHDLFSYRFPEIHSSVVPRRLNRLLIINAVNRASRIITPSNATAEDLVARFPQARRRVRAIAEAADARFNPERNRAAEASWLKYYGIKPPYLLYLGQWKSYKNVPLLIDAFARVHAQRPDYQLVLAGSDPRHPEVPAAAGRLPGGAVILPGHIADDAVPELYRAASAVAMPSRAEGFGLPVLEAMACGTPVVCSDIPVLREIAEGVAIFCDPTDPESFAKGILAAMARPPDDETAKLGVIRSQSYSWRKAAKETIEVYERALDG